MYWQVYCFLLAFVLTFYLGYKIYKANAGLLLTALLGLLILIVSYFSLCTFVTIWSRGIISQVALLLFGAINFAAVWGSKKTKGTKDPFVYTLNIIQFLLGIGFLFLLLETIRSLFQNFSNEHKGLGKILTDLLLVVILLAIFLCLLSSK